MKLRLLTAAPAGLEHALAREVAALRGEDPLAPISVVVGATLLRPYLRRRLAELNGAHINVHLLTPAELGLRVAERRLIAAGRRPLSAMADRMLVHEIAHEADRYFEPVKDAPGFAQVLGRLFRELRAALVTNTDLSAAVDGDGDVKHPELSRLYARYCEARAPFYDGEDCIAAIEPGDGEDLATHVYGVWQMPPLLRRALEHVASRAPVTVFLPRTGTSADNAHAEVRAWLTTRGAETAELADEPVGETALSQMQQRLFGAPRATAPDATAQLLSAPDPNREAREAVRTCLQWAKEGMPLYDIAIACRNTDTYRQFVESACREAGIAVYVHSGTQLTERPLGRQVLALLDLIDSDLPRAKLMELFAELRLPEKTWDRLGGLFSATWDEISRKAGVVRGLAQWRDRLNHYIEGQSKLEAERAVERDDDAEGGGEESGAAHAGSGADEDRAPQSGPTREGAAVSLLRFVDELAERFAARGEIASWSEHLAYLGGLLEEYIEGSAPLVESLAPLAELDEMGQPVSFARFRDAVRAAVEGLRVEDVTDERPAAFARRGINLLDVNSLRHVRFGAVAVLGLTERAFPPPARQDPLLLDEERVALSRAHGWELPLRARGADPEPLQFTLAVCAARERLMLSFARAEEAGGRAKLPSSFFRSAAEALTGARVTADDVDSIDERFYHRAGAGRIGASELERALASEDYDRTLLEKERRLGAAALARATPAFARSRALVRSRRWIQRLTAYDGLLGGSEMRELLAAAWGEERRFSPTGLEDYATCPYRFFLNHVLAVSSVEEPEEIERISALDKGSLMHGVFRSFLAEPPGAGNGKGDLERLLAIANAECEEFERRGVTGYPLLWRHDRSEILADLEAWYREELLDPERGAYPEADFEVRFGRPHPLEKSGRLSRDEPIALDLAGLKTLIHGRIDRLEWRPGERFRVIDYKTGSVRYAPADDELDGGRRLQLPLYMIAAGELLSIAPERGTAEYLFASRRGRFHRVSFEGAKLGDSSHGVPALLRELLEGVRTGDFHAQPSKDACKYCDFKGACDATRERDLERKSEDPLVERFQQRGEEYP